MKEIPIDELSKLAKKYGKDRMVLVSIDNETGTQWVTTYGKSMNDCNDACELGNHIKRDILVWPEELCNTKPTRTE